MIRPPRPATSPRGPACSRPTTSAARARRQLEHLRARRAAAGRAAAGPTASPRQPQALDLALQADEVARHELLQDRRARRLRHAQRVEQRRVQRRVAQPDAVGVQADGVEHLAQQLERLDRAVRARRADELDPRLQHLPRLPALRAHGAVGVGEVAEAQRRSGRRVARRHHARDRDRHVRAQHEHVALLVEQPVGGLGRRRVAARQRRLVLERRRRRPRRSRARRTPRAPSR